VAGWTGWRLDVLVGVTEVDVRVDVEGDLDLRGFFGFPDGLRPGYDDVRILR